MNKVKDLQKCQEKRRPRFACHRRTLHIKKESSVFIDKAGIYPQAQRSGSMSKAQFRTLNLVGGICALLVAGDVTLGYFDWEKKDYLKIPIREQVEVVSLIGDIAVEKDEPKVHAHVVVGKRDGSVMGGHLLAAHVRPTLEVMLSESPAQLTRGMDPESGLALIRV